MKHKSNQQIFLQKIIFEAGPRDVTIPKPAGEAPPKEKLNVNLLLRQLQTTPVFRELENTIRNQFSVPKTFDLASEIAERLKTLQPGGKSAKKLPGAFELFLQSPENREKNIFTQTLINDLMSPEKSEETSQMPGITTIPASETAKIKLAQILNKIAKKEIVVSDPINVGRLVDSLDGLAQSGFITSDLQNQIKPLLLSQYKELQKQVSEIINRLAKVILEWSRR